MTNPAARVAVTTETWGRSVIAVLANPALELVGCYAWSPDKVGRDVGELCGTPAAGVTATNDVAGVLGAPARLRRLQPEVAERQRSRADPRIGRERRHDRGVHHRRIESATTGRASPTRANAAELDLRIGNEPRPGEPARDRVGGRVRPDRLDHDHRVGRLDRIRLPRHGASRRVRLIDRRSRFSWR